VVCNTAQNSSDNLPADNHSSDNMLRHLTYTNNYEIALWVLSYCKHEHNYCMTVYSAAITTW